MDYQAGRQLIDELNGLIMHLDLTYEHHWKPGQLILWDNHALLHRGTSYDTERGLRAIRRRTLLGEVPH
jgi:alpha-ketoglutarate-dependent 2,4-dichlorophenoxyacetate dioxygenase